MNTLSAQNPDYLFMVEQAVKAPSGHNAQPWLFKMNDHSIEIHPNFDRSLPVVDPDNRELFVSLGCAAENLCIAASQRGYDPQVHVGDDGIIVLHLIKDESVKPDPLFEQIARRQTNRSVYNGQMIASDTIALLKKIPVESGITVHFYQNGTPDFDSIAHCVIEGNILQMQDAAFKEELMSWMRFNKRHQDKTNDGLSYAVFGAPNLPAFIVKPIMSKSVNATSQNKGDQKKIQTSSHFVLFTTQSDTFREWIDLGRTMERFLLKSTELGIIHAYLNQPNEIEPLSRKMAGILAIPDEYPTILLRVGYGNEMPYSKRRGIEEVLIHD